ncbi:hypothetical protein EBR96_06345, partial [bacterium]|nr:hypothetical protein [bacterium]
DQELDPTLMGGAEYFLNDRTSVVGDFTGKQKKYTVNVGFRFALYPDWTLRVNLLDLGNSGATAGTSSNYYSIGISHTQFL